MGVYTQQIVMCGVKLNDIQTLQIKKSIVGDEIKSVEGYGEEDFDMDYEIDELFYDSEYSHTHRRSSGNKDVKLIYGMDEDYKIGIIVSESDDAGAMDDVKLSRKKLKKLHRRAFEKIREHTSHFEYDDIRLLIFTNYT